MLAELTLGLHPADERRRYFEPFESHLILIFGKMGFTILILSISNTKWLHSNWPLTHCGRVTQYGDGSMLCKSPILFTMKEFPQI